MWSGVAGSIGSAVALFAVTNVDDIVILQHFLLPAVLILIGVVILLGAQSHLERVVPAQVTGAHSPPALGFCWIVECQAARAPDSPIR